MIYEVVCRDEATGRTVPGRYPCDDARVEPSGAFTLIRNGRITHCWHAGQWVYAWLVGDPNADNIPLDSRSDEIRMALSRAGVLAGSTIGGS